MSATYSVPLIVAYELGLTKPELHLLLESLSSGPNL
jgi:hypothetical protein